MLLSVKGDVLSIELSRWNAGLLLKILFSTGIAGYLIVSGRLEMSRLLAIQSFSLLWLCVGLRALASMLPVLRWYVLARGMGAQLPFAQAMHIGVIGNFFGAVAPATLGQDGARLFYGRKLDLAGSPTLVCSILADRFTGLSALILLGAGFGGWYLWPQFDARWLVFGGGVAVAAAGLGILAWQGAAMLCARFPSAGTASDALRRVRHVPGKLLVAFFLSIAAHLAITAGYYYAFRAIGASPPPLAVLAISPLLTLLRSVAITPMGLGVMEWSADLLYAATGQHEGAEAVMLIRLVGLMFALVCGLLFFVPMEKK
jgi:hypothetical protein